MRERDINKVYITSDSHYGHSNINAATSSWSDVSQCRKFPNIESMNDAIVDGINSVVGVDDELWHLGDWSFGGIQNIWEFRKRINCKNIHLIYGNHDEHIEANKNIILRSKEDLQRAYELDLVYTATKEKGNIIYSVDSQNLFSSVGYYAKLTYPKAVPIILSHYAMRVWDKSHHGSIMLYGHSHGSLDDLKPEFTEPTWVGDSFYIKNYRTQDVGFDVSEVPFHLPALVKELCTRDILFNHVRR